MRIHRYSTKHFNTRYYDKSYDEADMLAWSILFGYYAHWVFDFNRKYSTNNLLKFIR